MSLLPPKFQDPLLKTLGPPIRKEQENKPVEVEVSPGIWRVNGKLETRFPAPVLPMPVVIDYATIQTEVSEVDIPLPEFKPVWRSSKPKKAGLYKLRYGGAAWKNGKPCQYPHESIPLESAIWANGWEWLDEGR